SGGGVGRVQWGRLRSNHRGNVAGFPVAIERLIVRKANRRCGNERRWPRRCNETVNHRQSAVHFVRTWLGVIDSSVLGGRSRGASRAVTGQHARAVVSLHLRTSRGRGV